MRTETGGRAPRCIGCDHVVRWGNFAVLKWFRSHRDNAAGIHHRQTANGVHVTATDHFFYVLSGLYLDRFEYNDDIDHVDN